MIQAAVVFVYLAVVLTATSSRAADVAKYFPA